MNQLENKAKSNKNGNGSQLAGIEVTADPMPMELQPEQQLEQQHSDHQHNDHQHNDHQHNDPHFSLRSLRAEAEIYAISRTLEYTGWNRRRAAQLLSISYRGILYKIRQHNLTPRSEQTVPDLEQTVKVE